MTNIGSRPFSETAGGLHPAAATDRRVAPLTKTAPTSRLQESAAQTSQTKETQRLGSNAIQPVPQDGPTIAERAHCETERPVAATGTGQTAQSGESAVPEYPSRRDPVPPLREFAEIPSRTTAEILRLREERESEVDEAAAGDGDASAGRPMDDTPAPVEVPDTTEKEAQVPPMADVGKRLTTLRQLEATEEPTVDIHR